MRKNPAIAFFLAFMLCGCSRGATGVTIINNSDKPAATTLAPSPSPSKDFFVVKKKKQPETTGDIAFYLIPDSAFSGTIYTYLPNGAVIRLWLRYIDSGGNTTGEIQYLAVTSGYVHFSIPLQDDMPPQFIYIDASMRPDDAKNPQPQEIIDLYGIDGARLSGSNALTRPDGCKILQGIWHIPYPDADTAMKFQFEKWKSECSVKIDDVYQKDGVWYIVVDSSKISNGDSTHQSIMSSLRKLLLQMAESSQYADPSIILLDKSGAKLSSSGKDLFPAVPEPPKEVFISSNGAKYHESSCKYATKDTHKMPLYVVEQQGYEPCKLCH